MGICSPGRLSTTIGERRGSASIFWAASGNPDLPYRLLVAARQIPLELHISGRYILPVLTREPPVRGKTIMVTCFTP